ncbi:M48 family metallopeptidase [Streptomyces sp. NPDC054961]
MNGSTIVPDRLRDPFAVPSGTTLRFVLLVLSTTAVMMSFAASRFGHVEKGVERRFAEYEACWERDNGSASGFPAAGRPPVEEVCGADPRLVELWVPVTAALVFWLLILAVYWFLPAWRIRRRRFVPLGPELGDAHRMVEALRIRGGVEPVHWYVQPLDPRVSALAFGRWRRRCIVLSGGLTALRARRPETFEAVVLHELAHVRNRDIDVSFLTIVTARVGLPVLLLTLPSGILWELVWGLGGAGARAQGLANSLGTLCLVLVMPLARRAVLRSREFYADARAWQWSTSPLALRALFDEPEPRRRVMRGLLRVHPTARRRRAMFDDTGPLFRSGFWESCAVGCVAGALHSELGSAYVLNSALGARAGAAEDALALAVTGTLLGAVVVFVALRFDEGFPGARPRVLWVPAWGLACGLALGGGVVDPGTMFTLASTGQSGAGFLLWTAVLASAAYVAMRWMSGALRPWRHAIRLRKRRGTAWCVLIAVVGALFACVLHWLMELMIAEALMSTVLGPGTPEAVSFVLGAAMHAVAMAPYLLCATLLAAVLPLLGQALIVGPEGRASLELRRTAVTGVRWGVWLMAVTTVLAVGGHKLLGFLPATGALIFLAVHTGRRRRGAGLPFAHAVLASMLAAITGFVGADVLVALVDCGTGRCSVPGVGGMAIETGLGVVPALVVAACVPSARRGRRTRGAVTGPEVVR